MNKRLTVALFMILAVIVVIITLQKLKGANRQAVYLNECKQNGQSAEFCECSWNSLKATITEKDWNNKDKESQDRVTGAIMTAGFSCLQYADIK